MKRYLLIIFMFLALLGFGQRPSLHPTATGKLIGSWFYGTLAKDSIYRLELSGDTLFLNNKYRYLNGGGSGTDTTWKLDANCNLYNTNVTGNVRVRNLDLKKTIYVVTTDSNGLFTKYPIAALSDSIVEDTTNVDIFCTGLRVYATRDSTIWQHQVKTDPITGDTIGCEWIDVSSSAANWWKVITPVGKPSYLTNTNPSGFLKPARLNISKSLPVYVVTQHDTAGTEPLTKYPIAALGLPIVPDTTGLGLNCLRVKVYSLATNSMWQYDKVIDTVLLSPTYGDTICRWFEPITTTPNFWWNNGTDIYNYNEGFVGIGTSIPGFELDVDGEIHTSQNHLNVGNYRVTVTDNCSIPSENDTCLFKVTGINKIVAKSDTVGIKTLSIPVVGQSIAYDSIYVKDNMTGLVKTAVKPTGGGTGNDSTWIDYYPVSKQMSKRDTVAITNLNTNLIQLNPNGREYFTGGDGWMDMGIGMGQSDSLHMTMTKPDGFEIQSLRPNNTRGYMGMGMDIINVIKDYTNTYIAIGNISSSGRNFGIALDTFGLQKYHAGNSPYFNIGRKNNPFDSVYFKYLQLQNLSGSGSILGIDGSGNVVKTTGGGSVSITAAGGITCNPNPITGAGTIGVNPDSMAVWRSRSESVTYVQLESKIKHKQLIRGQHYYLSDFATTNFFLNGLVTLTAYNTATTEPLVLTATSDSSFDKVAFSPKYPNDVIYYDWNKLNWCNDKGFSSITGAGFDTSGMVTGFKGVIYFRHDLIQDNSTWYDFRGVKFRRWKVTVKPYGFTTDYISPSDSTAALTLYQDVYTFNLYRLVSTTRIGRNHSAYPDPPVTTLNNIVFVDLSIDDSPTEGDGYYIMYDNYIGDRSYNSTISGFGFYQNRFDEGFVDDIITGGCSGNKAGNSFGGNKIYKGFNSNNIDPYYSGNTHLGDFIDNNVATTVHSNVFKGTAIYNYFGPNVTLNTFPANFQRNNVETLESAGDLSAATRLTGDYSKRIFKDKNGVYKVEFTNTAGMPVIEAITSTATGEGTPTVQSVANMQNSTTVSTTKYPTWYAMKAYADSLAGLLARVGQTMYMGTTAVAINRGSGALSLTGVGIDGNAGTVSNGFYTTNLKTDSHRSTLATSAYNTVTANEVMDSIAALKQSTANLITTTGTSATKYMSQGAVKSYGDSIAANTQNWKDVTGTYTSASTFTFTGTQTDITRYTRSLFTCFSAPYTATAVAETDYIAWDRTTLGKTPKVGDAIWFTSGTLPTASPALTTGRAYYVAAAKLRTGAAKDSIQISGSPTAVTVGSLVKIDLTEAGTSPIYEVQKVGYVDSLTISGTTLTAIIQGDTILASGDNTFKIGKAKLYEFLRTITIPGSQVTDATNPQGMLYANIPNPSYLLPVDASVQTAATGTGHQAFNMYSNTTALFGTAPDMTTNTTLLAQVPTTKFIQKNSTITLRITNAAGTLTAVTFQARFFYIPVFNYTQP